jgi:hypothetical protein
MLITIRNHFLFFISILLVWLPCVAHENFLAVHWGVEEKMPVSHAFGMIKDVNVIISPKLPEDGL